MNLQHTRLNNISRQKYNIMYNSEYKSTYMTTCNVARITVTWLILPDSAQAGSLTVIIFRQLMMR